MTEAERGPMRVIVLGGGSAGTMVANRLRRARPPDELIVTVVDRDDAHLYQPGLLFVPFTDTPPARLIRSRHAQLRPGVGFVRACVDHVDTGARLVHLEGSHHPLGYDVLVVASGAALAVDETPGLTGTGWHETVHTFYDLPGAEALRRALQRMDRGRLVVNVADMPIKCPVAPLEFCFLADAYFRRRGVRDRVEITYSTPLDAAFTKPVAADALGGLLVEKDIRLVTDFTTAEVDGATRVLRSYDGRELPFDLAVVVPLHGGAQFVQRSPGLGDALGFVPVDRATLQAIGDPQVFALGDAADVPTSKAGSVAHFEAEIVAANVLDVLARRRPSRHFDGHANCFVETGDGKALLIDFNYDDEPVPGHYPAAVGLPLLHESRLNHLGKRAFANVYWHVLLPGRDLPGIGSAMPRRGKQLPVPTR